MCTQRKDESFENYYIRLRSLASTCEYGRLTDELIKDRIVIGIVDENVRKRLLQEQNLNLQSCLDICRAHEASKVQSQAMSSESVASLRVTQKPGKKFPKRPKSGEVRCKFCGYTHAMKRDMCPAYGKTCNKCKGQNNFASRCTGAGSEKKETK